jgi:hypothetical protein
MYTETQEKIQVKVPSKATIALGVFLGMWLFCLSVGAIAGVVWIVAQTRRQQQAERQAQYDRAQQVVSPAFKKQATNVANDIHLEYAAARDGWKKFNAVHQSLTGEISDLEIAAQTTHESIIAANLQNLESTFSECVGDEIGPHFPQRNLPGCYAESPESKIDQILNN